MFFAAQVHSPEPLRYHLDLALRGRETLLGPSGSQVAATPPWSTAVS